jgi:hypothetical protein
VTSRQRIPQRHINGGESDPDQALRTEKPKPSRKPLRYLCRSKRFADNQGLEVLDQLGGWF